MDTYIFPSFSKQKGIEFVRNILLGEFQNAKLFRIHNLNFSFLSVLLRIKVNDQTKEMNKILFKWGIECFLNTVHSPKVHPKVPFDYSCIHPELNLPDKLIDYAQSYPSRLLSLLEDFPFEFYKNIGEFNNENAINFIMSCTNNPEITIFLIAKFISLFPIKSYQFNMEYILEKRCDNLVSLCDLFEGLLCNFENKQVNSFQILSSHFDSKMNDQVIVLINSSLRSYEFFVEKNIALSIHLFPNLMILPFLLQISSTPISQLLIAINTLEPNNFITKLHTFLLLSSYLRIEGKYEQIYQFSIPFLLGENHFTHDFIETFQRDSEIFFISKRDWNVDYDFIRYFITIEDLFENNDTIMLPSEIIIDLFSLLFIQNKSKDYIFDFEKAYYIIRKIDEYNLFPIKYQNFINKALFKCKAVMMLFDKPNLNYLFLPEKYMFQKSLHTLSSFQSIINISNDYPNFVLSKIFSLKVLENFKIQSTNNLNPFHNRKSKRSVDFSFQSFLEGFSEEQKEIFLLDLSSSYEEFTMIFKQITPIHYSDYIEKIHIKHRKYPKIINLNQPKTSSEFIKMINSILLYDLPTDSYLRNFCIYLRHIVNKSDVLAESLRKSPEKVLNSFKSLKEAESFFQIINFDIKKIVFSSNYSLNINKMFLKKLINKYPLYSIPLCISNFSKKDIANEITDKNFMIVKKYLQLPSKKEDNDINLNEIINELEHMNQQQAMIVLDDLIYSYELENYFDRIILLINKYPVKWCIQFLETFLALLPKDSIILIPLSQKIAELKPKFDLTNKSEIFKTCAQYNHFMKYLVNFDNIFQNPEMIYRLSFYHLQNHIIGDKIVLIIQTFTKILIFIKNSKIFSSQEKEKIWINKYISNNLSKLSNKVLARMIVDIGLNFSYECGLGLSKICNLDYTEPIIEKLPQSIKLFEYASNLSQLIENVLSAQIINSNEKEIYLLNLFSKMNQYSNISLKYDILHKMCKNLTFHKTKICYSGANLEELREICEKTDQKNIILLLENNHITLTEEFKTKCENIKKLFGIGINAKDNNKLVFKNNENKSVDLSYFENNQQPIYLFNINDDLMTFSKNKNFNNIYSSFYIPPDFDFFDLSYQPSSLRIYNNVQNSITETISFHKNINKNIEEERLNINNKVKLFDMVMKHLQQSNLIDLFRILSNNSLHLLLEYANQNNFIYFILQLVIYVIENPERYEIFIFPQSILRCENNDNLNVKLYNFIIGIKTALTLAFRLTKHIKNELLFPSSIILNGNERELKDLILVLEYQNQIGIDKISLFNPEVDKSSLLSQLFINFDFERGFALVRILHVDIDDVMIKSAVHFAESSNYDLGQFLFKIIPKLNPETANKLIETFSSILCRNEENRMVFKYLMLDIDEPKTVYQMLKWFGFDEASALIALQSDLFDEIEITLKDAKKKKLNNIISSCYRWKREHFISLKT